MWLFQRLQRIARMNTKDFATYLLFIRVIAFTTITNDVIIPDIKEIRIIVANVEYAMYINTLVSSA